jgi:hypothetical protein
VSSKFNTRCQIVCGLLFASLAMGEEAVACRAASSQTTIFFDHVPPGIAVQAIARVTVAKIVGPTVHTLSDGRPMGFDAVARVDEVIKGPITSATIKIVAPRNDCQLSFAVGAAGIVLGTLEPDESGELRLKLKSHFARPWMRNSYPEYLQE